MQTLIIKDLIIAAELDGKTMSAVRGGTSYGSWTKSHLLPSYSSYSSTTDVKISQQNNQVQSNPTGNGSAVFGGGISAWNNQQGFNSVGGFGGYGIPVPV
ncbi:hypothetical protein D3870_05490 [Noviherbaspirillum cavernae]|uniref:Uncharacterized protein n=1 Tax=Noviherbaspirillum cavernae TaxID=2320862 RepID=A0A418WZ80_9BURK|nr:hypothetical protein [Noviherbaspirillum cavernae]RJG05540.1 hypothetical protein D3870_05490 [Noviherbaspirillum cavernae]